jgi:hypothetical protein
MKRSSTLPSVEPPWVAGLTRSPKPRPEPVLPHPHPTCGRTHPPPAEKEQGVKWNQCLTVPPPVRCAQKTPFLVSLAGTPGSECPNTTEEPHPSEFSSVMGDESCLFRLKHQELM